MVVGASKISYPSLAEINLTTSVCASEESLSCHTAGKAGLALAKRRHPLYPGETLVIIDSATTPGGVWAERRSYTDLKTNSVLGTYEDPDFPTDT